MAWAFLLTVGAPLWSLALGPVLLGVPHLLSDVRYLVVRPGLHRRTGLAVCAGVPLLAVGLGAGPEVGLLALVPVVLGARWAGWRKALVWALWVGLTVLAVRSGAGFQRVFLLRVRRGAGARGRAGARAAAGAGVRLPPDGALRRLAAAHPRG
ncbi:hypothetical protein P2318_25100 [Myxococcaceae bacterium GXIMD 01537]